jgi:uncharacterized protein YjiS (DUF1127 family)
MHARHNALPRTTLPRPHGLARLFWLVLRLRRDRAALGRMDAHLLADIGIDPGQARAEAARPVWDAPAFWSRIRGD